MGASKHVLHNRLYLFFILLLLGGLAVQFRQTTMPHRLHGATRSRAQGLSLLVTPDDV